LAPRTTSTGEGAHNGLVVGGTVGGTVVVPNVVDGSDVDVGPTVVLVGSTVVGGLVTVELVVVVGAALVPLVVVEFRGLVEGASPPCG
jgi:hypothetical protein